MGSEEEQTIMEAPYVIRPAASLEEMHDFFWPAIQRLGWNLSPTDSSTFYHAADPDAWLLLIPHESGKPEGCVVTYIYENNTGFLGFFIVNEQYQGRGWGAALFRATQDYYQARGVEIVGLDGVAQQRKTYERRGFVETALVRNMTREGLKEKPLKERVTKEDVLSDGQRMVDLKDVPADSLLQSDLAHTGLLRKRFWTPQVLLDRPDIFGFAIVEDDPSRLIAWLLAHPVEKGWRFGPLYAETAEQATLLLTMAMENTDGTDGALFAEVWVQNRRAQGVFVGLGWRNLGMDYHRMWVGGRAPREQMPGGRAERGCFANWSAGMG